MSTVDDSTLAHKPRSVAGPIIRTVDRVEGHLGRVSIRRDESGSTSDVMAHGYSNHLAGSDKSNDFR